MMYLSSIMLCADHIKEVNHKSADNLAKSVNASNVDERTPLKKMLTFFVNKPKTDLAISVRLLHATSRVEQMDRCQLMSTDSSCRWNLYRVDLELGVSYNLQVQNGNEILTVISIPAPGIGQHASTL